ncbi:MAG: hypothetical protein M1147_09355 [Nitrospirae bacterium]|nr:hypothetical protein [Nitrospirota bacterium]MCL5978302.1 hypothetical protein [Nitrospirota bacterium]
MKSSQPAKQKEPLLYFKTKEDIQAYRKKSVMLKLQWLEAQMEFFHKVMPEKAKRIREGRVLGNQPFIIISSSLSSSSSE